MGKDTLGELEEMVLLAVVRLGDDAYGLEIVEELKRTAGRTVSRSAVYVLLRRLERAGLIERHAGPAGGGTRRRLVRATDRALGLLREARDARLRMWAGIGPALEGS